jgi:tetratricopeptide (TPR) repeat protein
MRFLLFENALLPAACLLMTLSWSSSALAEHPIEVQRLTAKQQYFEALTHYEKLARRQVTSDVLEAAGRSAWALGLSDQAAEHFDHVLRDETLTESQEGRLLLMRATLELQEDRPRVAILFAERALKRLQKDSKLKGAIRILWGDALSSMEQHGAAKRKYEEAIESVAYELVPEVAFRLGRELRALGEMDRAIEYYRKVPVAHERAAESLRALAEISLEQADYTALDFWLRQGKDRFPDAFLDSWVEYARGRAALGNGDLDELRRVRVEALEKYPPSDSWVTLLDAFAEKVEWTSRTQKQ